MYYKYVETHKAVRDAKEKGESKNDPCSERQVRHALWGSTQEKPNGRVGRSREAHGRWSRAGSVFCRRWKRNVSGAILILILVSVEFNFVFVERFFCSVRKTRPVAAFALSPIWAASVRRGS